MYARVKNLFGNQPDLLEEFKYFLPENNNRRQKMEDDANDRIIDDTRILLLCLI